MSAAENIPSPDASRVPIPTALILELGGLANNPEAEFFEALTPSEFYDTFTDSARQQGLLPKALAPGQEAEFALFTHGAIHGYHLKKHQSECNRGSSGGDPSPLPRGPFQKRLTAFYSNPDIKLRDSDRVHRENLLRLHHKSIPLALKFCDKLPEIAQAFNIRDRFEASKFARAGETVDNILTVYGLSLQSLIHQAHTNRVLRAQAAQRRQPF